MEVDVVFFASEFPNDNPNLHLGTIWVCRATTGPAEPEHCTRKLEEPPAWVLSPKTTIVAAPPPPPPSAIVIPELVIEPPKIMQHDEEIAPPPPSPPIIGEILAAFVQDIVVAQPVVAVVEEVMTERAPFVEAEPEPAFEPEMAQPATVVAAEPIVPEERITVLAIEQLTAQAPPVIEKEIEKDEIFEEVPMVAAAVETEEVPMVAEEEAIEEAIVVEELEPVEFEGLVVEGSSPPPAPVVMMSMAPEELIAQESVTPIPAPAFSEVVLKSDDPFILFASTLADVALASGSPLVAAVLPGLLHEGRLSETLDADTTSALIAAGVLVSPTEVAPSFRAVASAWSKILRGTSDDFDACGGDMLDEWSADLLARLLNAPARASTLRSELRSRGVAAFGLAA